MRVEFSALRLWFRGLGFIGFIGFIWLIGLMGFIGFMGLGVYRVWGL